MINHAFLSSGLDNVAFVVQDSPYLSAIIRAVKLERDAMLIIGRQQVRALRDLQHLVEPEVAEMVSEFVTAGERVF